MGNGFVRSSSGRTPAGRRMLLSAVLMLIGCGSIAFANSITVDENAARSGTVKNLFASITPTSGDFVFCELGVAAGGSDCVAKAVARRGYQRCASV